MVVPALDEEVLIAPGLATMLGFVDRVYVVGDCSSDGSLARGLSSSLFVWCDLYWFYWVVCVNLSPLFTRDFLTEVRRRALRRGQWMRVLDGVERGIICLAGRCVDTVMNATLGRVIVGILVKLRDASRSGFARHVESFGWSRVAEIKEQLVMFGYALADGLERDVAFVRYLTFLDWNQPPGGGLGVARNLHYRQNRLDLWFSHG